jgi:hypothetical protein
MPREQLPAEVSALLESGDQRQLFYFLLSAVSQAYIRPLQAKTQALLQSRERNQLALGQQLDTMFKTRQEYLNVQTMVDMLSNARLNPECRVITSMVEEVFNSIFDDFSLKNTQSILKKITERYQLPTLVKALPTLSVVMNLSEQLTYLNELDHDLTHDERRRQTEGKNVMEALQEDVLKGRGSNRNLDQERRQQLSDVKRSQLQLRQDLQATLRKLTSLQMEAIGTSLANLSRDASKIPGRVKNYQEALQKTQPYLQKLGQYRTG